MIITTSAKETDALTEKAVDTGAKYGLTYVSRQNKSIEYFLDHVDPQVFVVNDFHGLSYYEKGQNEAFFHPNMAFLRIQNLQKGRKDSFIEICGLHEGMSYLDATLGLASDALVASHILGPDGICTGIEKSQVVYILVKEGLSFFADSCNGKNAEMSEVARRIDIHHMDNLDYLKSCKEKSYDVIYFDFMFSSPIMESTGLQVIRSYTARDEMTTEHIEEAVRVAKKSVIARCDRVGMEKLTRNGFQLMKKSSKGSFYYMGNLWD